MRFNYSWYTFRVSGSDSIPPCYADQARTHPLASDEDRSITISYRHKESDQFNQMRAVEALAQSIASKWLQDWDVAYDVADILPLPDSEVLSDTDRLFVLNLYPSKG